MLEKSHNLCPFPAVPRKTVKDLFSNTVNNTVVETKFKLKTQPPSFQNFLPELKTEIIDKFNLPCPASNLQNNSISSNLFYCDEFFNKYENSRLSSSLRLSNAVQTTLSINSCSETNLSINQEFFDLAGNTTECKRDQTSQEIQPYSHHTTSSSINFINNQCGLSEGYSYQSFRDSEMGYTFKVGQSAYMSMPTTYAGRGNISYIYTYTFDSNRGFYHGSTNVFQDNHVDLFESKRQRDTDTFCRASHQQIVLGNLPDRYENNGFKFYQAVPFKTYVPHPIYTWAGSYKYIEVKSHYVWYKFNDVNLYSTFEAANTRQGWPSSMAQVGNFRENRRIFIFLPEIFVRSFDFFPKNRPARYC